MAKIKIIARENGPLMIPAKATYVNKDGETIETTKPQIAICRCGLSENAPFCDGKHKGAFTAPLCEIDLDITEQD